MTERTAIGALRHRIAIDQPVTTGDGGGGAVVSWTQIAEVWAAIEPAGAAERDISGRLDGVVTHRVTIRYRTDIASGMRIRHDGRTFRLLAVHDPDERRRRSECLAEEEER